MFRYAALILDELNRRSQGGIAEVLCLIRAGLYGIYVWILDHLSTVPAIMQIRKRVLIWEALVAGPKTVYEMSLVCETADYE